MLKRLESLDVVTAEDAEPRSVLNAAATFDLVRRRWRFVAAATALIVVAGWLYLMQQTPLYVASASLLFDPLREHTAGLDPAPVAALDAAQIENQMAILRSTALLRRVVASESLDSDPEFVGRRAPPRLTNWLSGGDATSAPSDPRSASERETIAVERLKGTMAVARSGQSLVLVVSVGATDPNKAARLANAVADAFVLDMLEIRFEAARRASRWLGDRLADLKHQLRESEAAVAKFKADNNLVAIGGARGATLTEEQLAQLNGRLVAARADAAERRARLDVLQQFLARGGAAEQAPDVANSPTVADLRREIGGLQRQEADLLARYSDRHPSLVAVRAEIANRRRALATEATRLTGEVQRDYDAAMARAAAVEKTLEDATGRNDLDEAHAITLRELERNAAADRALFEDFLQRSKTLEEQSTYTARDARVITPALPPGGPSQPNAQRILLSALVLGLTLGVGGAYGLDALDQRFSSPRQVEELLGQPVLAILPQLDAKALSLDGAILTLPELLVARPEAALSEAIRGLRGAVHMSDVDAPPRLLLTTSTLAGEGKSTLAQLLAASAAQSGRRALLVDADLRQGTTTRALDLGDRAGLVDYLIGDVELTTAIVQAPQRGHCVLPCGAPTLNAPDLLSSARFRAAIAALSGKFDLVILDAPPLEPVVDAIALARVADKILFVVGAGAPRVLTRQALQRLPDPKRIAGIVLNGSSTTSRYAEGYVRA